MYQTKCKHLTSEIRAPTNEVQNMSALPKWLTSSTLTRIPKESIFCGLRLLAALSVLIGGHSSEGQCSCPTRSLLCVCLCISRQNKTKKKSNILYSLCIMILFLVVITILWERVGCLTVISLHMYFFIHSWMSFYDFVIRLLVSFTFFFWFCFFSGL